MTSRRNFIILLSGAAVAWPVTVRAQQPVPVIGLLSSGALESDSARLDAFRQGLNEVGFVDGRNVAFEYRGMQGHYDLAPAFVADFVRRPVSVIVAIASTPATLAAKAATSTIPIVFNIGNDPVEAGIVSSFNRPGGNITGISNLTGPLAAKRLELLRELMPSAATIAVLANPSNPALTEYEMAGLKKAAARSGSSSTFLMPARSARSTLHSRRCRRLALTRSWSARSSFLPRGESSSWRSRPATRCLPATPTSTLQRLGA